MDPHRKLVQTPPSPSLGLFVRISATTADDTESGSKYWQVPKVPCRSALGEGESEGDDAVMRISWFMF